MQINFFLPNRPSTSPLQRHEGLFKCKSSLNGWGSRASRASHALIRLAAAAIMLLSPLLQPAVTVRADAVLTLIPLTWNVVGLDSNNVNVGPDTFPVGVRICNNGDAVATNIQPTFNWGTPSDLYINLRSGSYGSAGNPYPVIASLAAGACTSVYSDVYFEVQLARNAGAYDHSRPYQISITYTSNSNNYSTSTPSGREIYVERLISQNRNSTTDVILNGTQSIPAGGGMTLLVDHTYTITLVAGTATNGYEQIESYINFPNTIFQVNSVATTYFANGGTDSLALTKPYADGCGWVNDYNAPNYRSCIGTGKYGGTVTVTYDVTVISGGGTSQPLNNLIYDFSGSSYHYNSDYAVGARIVSIVDPDAVTIQKAFFPSTTTVGGISTLTFTLTNPNTVALTGAAFTDNLPTSPGAMVVASPPNATTANCGTPTWSRLRSLSPTRAPRAPRMWRSPTPNLPSSTSSP